MKTNDCELRNTENNSFNDDFDTIVIHRNDKKKLTYDTTINVCEYDATGNLVRRTVSDLKGNVQNILITQYSGDEKTFSFNLTSEGDTTAKFTYKHQGIYLIEITEAKKIGMVDTTWFERNRVVKIIGHNNVGLKHKYVTNYNNKGDEIEEIAYR